MKTRIENKIVFLVVIFIAVVIIIIFSVYNHPQKPTIKIINPIIDLGLVDETIESRRLYFHIRNVGKETLKLTKVQVSCPCLDIKLNNSILSHGQEAVLSGTFKPSSKPGKWSDEIFLFSNDPKHSVTKLRVEAYIELNCIALPNNISIDNLMFNENRDFEIEVLGQTNDETFEILNVSTVNKEIRLLDINEEISIRKTNKKRYKIKFSVGRKSVDTWEDIITIATSNSKVPELEVPITIRQTSIFKIAPRIITLRQTEENTISSFDVEISTNIDMAPLTISKIECTDWLDIKIDNANKNTILLNTKIVENNFKKNKEGEVIITINNNIVNIPVLYFAK